jgi:Xaa-Pro aminopeptidase
MTEMRKIAYQVFEGSDARDAAGGRLGQYFIHGLGHHLGLDAHDPVSEDTPLEPGMVVTNEPGIYIPDEALGVRIEDDHLITSDGNENLSADLPTHPDEIESLMRGEQQ